MFRETMVMVEDKEVRVIYTAWEERYEGIPETEVTIENWIQLVTERKEIFNNQQKYLELFESKCIEHYENGG